MLNELKGLCLCPPILGVGVHQAWGLVPSPHSLIKYKVYPPFKVAGLTLTPYRMSSSCLIHKLAHQGMMIPHQLVISLPSFLKATRINALGKIILNTVRSPIKKCPPP